MKAEIIRRFLPEDASYKVMSELKELERLATIGKQVEYEETLGEEYKTNLCQKRYKGEVK